MDTRLICKFALSTAVGGMLVFGTTGCNDDKDDGPTPAAANVPARPDSLDAAALEIRANKPADAQQRMEAYLKEQPKGAFTAEALYLLGQAQAAQGQHEDAKKTLDEAVDKTDNRNLKALAMLGRADCNMAMGKYQLASRQYHWLETMYRDVKAVPQDEVLFKLGLSTKKAGFDETADHWFKQVIEMYATSPYAEKAKQYHTAFNPKAPGVEPRVYTLEVDTFSTLKKAEAEADILRSKGYKDIQIVETTRNDYKVYEVHVGKFGNKNDAARAQTDAELAGLPTTIRPTILEPLK
jgi:TolA-binding protein